MKYFKVQIGFESNEYISIDETELAMALRAMITGKIGSFKEGAVAGRVILSITPDWNREMGWKRGYAISGEDFQEISSKRVKEYREHISRVKLEVEAQLGGGSDRKLLDNK